MRRENGGSKVDKPRLLTSNRYWETVEWMTWMQSGIGPMQGQANHFYRYAPEKIEYAVNRYQSEVSSLHFTLVSSHLIISHLALSASNLSIHLYLLSHPLK